MPVKIPNNLPAASTLALENIFVMDASRAQTQDIRPLKIVILNLMPSKEATETQLLRLLGNTSIQIEAVFLKTSSYISTNTSAEYLSEFYQTFDEIKDQNFDGLIITGAPVELMDFEEVAYWDELCGIMDWAKSHVFSTFYICWAAQAGLYYHYNINKQKLDQKLSGIFSHDKLEKNCKLLRGFDDVFFAPHSRNTTVNKQDVINHKDLVLLCDSKEAGVYIAMSNNGRHVFVTGHSEYDPNTLHNEYLRDFSQNPDILPPKNYYPNDDMTKPPIVLWRSHANLLFANWLNYYVYQETPYNLSKINI